MTLKSLLVPVEECDGLNAQLTTALLAAKLFGSHIDGVAPRLIIEAYGFGDGMGAAAGAAIESFEQEADEKAERAEAAFRAFMDQQKVAWEESAAPSAHPTVDWLPDGPRGNEAAGELARLYDMTVLARPVAHAMVPRIALLESVLFECGRPILVAPPQAPASLGETILIAWNGSTESARALTFARPFLERAKRVVVLSVEGGSVMGPEAADVEKSLRRGGIAAEAKVIGPGSLSVGEAILSEADALNADLVVKGAYTHSRLRQMIFGGATHHLLAEADLPVLMAH